VDNSLNGWTTGKAGRTDAVAPGDIVVIFTRAENAGSYGKLVECFSRIALTVAIGLGVKIALALVS